MLGSNHHWMAGHDRTQSDDGTTWHGTTRHDIVLRTFHDTTGHDVIIYHSHRSFRAARHGITRRSIQYYHYYYYYYYREHCYMYCNYF